MFSNDPRVVLAALSNTTAAYGPVELRVVDTTPPVRQWLGQFVKITTHNAERVVEYGLVTGTGVLEGRGHDDSLWALWAFDATRARHYFVISTEQQMHPMGENIHAGRLTERRASEHAVEIVPMPEPERVPTAEPRPTTQPWASELTRRIFAGHANPSAGTIRTSDNGAYQYTDGYGNWRNFPPADQPAPEAPKEPKKVKKKAVEEPEPEKLPLRKILIKGDKHD